MKENNPQREDRDQIRELLNQYENFKNGRKHAFIEEDAFERIIEYYQENENLSEATAAAEIGCSQFPYSASLMIKKADILLARRNYQDALDILEQASLYDTQNINIYILKTDAYLALDQQEKAVTLLEEALQMFEGEERIELLFELADVYDDYEDFDKVFDCLKMILEDEPLNDEALYKICFWTDFTGRNEESIRLHQKIIDEYPYSELAWFNLGAAYQGLKLYEKAIDAYQYAVTVDEKFDYAYRNMGDAYIRLRKYKEAIEVLEKVTELAKPEDVIFEAIGYCYDKMKRYSQARFYYRKATHLRPDDSRIIYKMACTYFNEGRWDSCLKQLEAAFRMKKIQPEYYLLAGECRLQQGYPREASQQFVNAVGLRPKNSVAWEALVRSLFMAEEYDDAYEQAVSAIKITSKKTLFTFYKAAALMAAGKIKEGLLQLEEAMEKQPKLLKKFIELNPSILQNQQVVDLLARFKRKKSI